MIISSVKKTLTAALSLSLLVGCTGGSGPDTGSAASTAETDTANASSETSAASDSPEADAADAAETSESSEAADSSAAPTAYKPVQLGDGGGSSTEAAAGDSGSTGTADEEPKFDDIVDALKPIQIVLGKWQGILRNASKHETYEWVWDLKSDPNQPALVMTAPDGEFFTRARLTYDPRSDKYLMTMVDSEGEERKFEGEFTEEPQEVPSEEGKGVERTFELQFTEVSDEDRRKRFQYVFKQRHNDRYLVDVKQARGKAPFRLVDVIGTQREGVAFAKADNDYGDKTCIISGGLGTTTVSYKGRTYYVCCSGCKAAFEEEPERWIARLEKKKSEEQK